VYARQGVSRQHTQLVPAQIQNPNITQSSQRMRLNHRDLIIVQQDRGKRSKSIERATSKRRDLVSTEIQVHGRWV
jgi:hypothetical protein